MLLLPETKRNIIVWIVAGVIIPIVIVPLYFFSSLNLSDCFLIFGGGYLAIAGLAFIHRAGTFDTFEYQFSSWMTSFRRNSPKKYRSANEYHLQKEERRHHNPFPYLPFLVYGGLALIATIVLALMIVNSGS